MASDPQQTAALAALEPFLALTPSATSPRAAADLVSRALAAPGTSVFAELLGAPTIQALSAAGTEPQHARWLEALRVFAWGTWQDYQGNAALPGLSPPQANKLRLLTLLTLARTSDLSYAALQGALGLGSARDVEALVTQAMYAGLLDARLDPALAKVRVASVAPLRDLAPGRLGEAVALLDAWERRCADVLAEVEARVAAVRDGARQRDTALGEWDRVVDARLAGVEEREGVKRKGDTEGGGVKKGGRFVRRGG